MSRTVYFDRGTPDLRSVPHLRAIVVVCKICHECLCIVGLSAGRTGAFLVCTLNNTTEDFIGLYSLYRDFMSHTNVLANTVIMMFASLWLALWMC